MSTPTPFYFTTRELEALTGVHSTAIAARVRRTGHFEGMTPRTLPNMKGWAWPRSEVRKYLGTSHLAGISAATWELQRHLAEICRLPAADALRTACNLSARRREPLPTGQHREALAADLAQVLALVDAAAARIAADLADLDAQLRADDLAALVAVSDRLTQRTDHIGAELRSTLQSVELRGGEA